MKQRNRRLLFVAAITVFSLHHPTFADDVTVTSQEQKVTTTRYTYDAVGTYGSDASGGVTRYTYDGRTSTTDSTATPPTTAYDAQDRISEPTPGTPSTYTYDALDTITRGSTSDTPPDDTHNGDTYTSPDIGGSIHYQYDSLGRDTLQETDPLGKTTQYQYDSRQGVTESDGGDPLGNTTRYQYDSLNRTIDSGGTLQVDDGTTYGSESTGTGTTDFQNLTRYQYDALGRVTLTDGTSVGYTLDLQLMDTTTHTTIFQYDTSGTLNNINPSFFISPTLIPLEDLNGPLTPGDGYEYKYNLDVTGLGKVDYDFSLSAVPAPSACLGGVTLLAAMAGWKYFSSKLTRPNV